MYNNNTNIHRKSQLSLTESGFARCAYSPNTEFGTEYTNVADRHGED